MAVLPYGEGDAILVLDLDSERAATVRAVVGTPSLDPGRRWRLMFRFDDDPSGVPDLPVYCGDDGIGDLVRPLAASGASLGLGEEDDVVRALPG